MFKELCHCRLGILHTNHFMASFCQPKTHQGNERILPMTNEIKTLSSNYAFGSHFLPITLPTDVFLGMCGCHCVCCLSAQQHAEAKDTHQTISGAVPQRVTSTLNFSSAPPCCASRTLGKCFKNILQGNRVVTRTGTRTMTRTRMRTVTRTGNRTVTRTRTRTVTRTGNRMVTRTRTRTRTRTVTRIVTRTETSLPFRNVYFESMVWQLQASQL